MIPVSSNPVPEQQGAISDKNLTPSLARDATAESKFVTAKAMRIAITIGQADISTPNCESLIETLGLSFC